MHAWSAMFLVWSRYYMYHWSLKSSAASSTTVTARTSRVSNHRVNLNPNYSHLIPYTKIWADWAATKKVTNALDARLQLPRSTFIASVQSNSSDGSTAVAEADGYAFPAGSCWYVCGCNKSTAWYILWCWPPCDKQSRRIFPDTSHPYFTAELLARYVV